MHAQNANNVNGLLDVPESTTSADSIELPSLEVCVICLDRITEKATSLPCHHDQFDFSCLGTWIQQQRVCPLCKSEVTAIRYRSTDGQGSPVLFTLPPQEDRSKVGNRDLYNDRDPRRGHGRVWSEDSQRYRPYRSSNRYSRRRPIVPRTSSQQPPSEKDSALEFRRHVYRHKLYSLRVGTNRISRYRNITPSTFQSNAQLVTRAKIFVRRELAVFDFLNPSSASFGHTNRRASNAEFLLEYIMSILKTVDLKASTGQAEELLTDFLGRDNARLFLHEVEAWLRSPYERLADWDRHVQYDGGTA